MLSLLLCVSGIRLELLKRRISGDAPCFCIRNAFAAWFCGISVSFEVGCWEKFEVYVEIRCILVLFCFASK